MSNNKYTEGDPERTLLTLDQLSQTIEVMTSVVNRLRQHLSEQILARKAMEQKERETQECKACRTAAGKSRSASGSKSRLQEGRESFVVEVSQPESDAPQPKGGKVLH